MSAQEIRRIYVRKKSGFAVEASGLLYDLQVNFGLTELKEVCILNRYDMSGLEDEEFREAVWTVFAEPPADEVYYGDYDFSAEDYVLAVEALPGQYDQRADSAEQAVQVLTRGARPRVRTAKVFLFRGNLSRSACDTLRSYLINPVESRLASLELPENLEASTPEPQPVPLLYGFRELEEDGLEAIRLSMGLAMTQADLVVIRDYFRTVDRDPSLTEVRVLDTYWSDHCRHTTFNTELRNIYVQSAPPDDPVSRTFSARLESSLDRYMGLRASIHGLRLARKPLTLMDMATIGMKELRRQGLLQDLDESEEINACSIKIKVPADGAVEDYLLMFKNETHNHPTEIEPFGGAATCLGGAIRDPLSGRSYVYQAMRVSGSGDPTVPVSGTLPGKLPQRKITTAAAAGYSSYGNQIGLATGHVAEIYHPGYIAKRMEIGAVIAAVPASQVVREVPLPGDKVILLGGRTGRDGIGGATGSSKQHDDTSLETSGSEVQKGNPLTERNLQRFFRHPEAARMIRRCNDFGAGGVSVAIGELADGVSIDLDRVTVKYEGLDGTELAISESQERMACVVRPGHAARFIELAASENLEAVEVARITREPRMVMYWRGEKIVDLERSFLDTNGAPQYADAIIEAVNFSDGPAWLTPSADASFMTDLASRLSDLRYASQKGLAERFDSTIGANTVLMPFGGRTQLTPEEGMAARLPLRGAETSMSSLMTYGFDADLSLWSPYHGAYYAVLESVARQVAMGASPAKIRLTFQEYFPRLSSPEKWGLPTAALLGALDAQLDLKAPSIGGKDSMSGSFGDLDVPPTLVSFAVSTRPAEQVHSAVLREAGSQVYLLPVKQDALGLPAVDEVLTAFRVVHSLHKSGRIRASATAKAQGPALTAVQMCFGEHLGFAFNEELEAGLLLGPAPGALILEVPADGRQSETAAELMALGAVLLGHTASAPIVSRRGECVELDELISVWQSRLAGVFPPVSRDSAPAAPAPETVTWKRPESAPTAQDPAPVPYVSSARGPKVLIPVFPGTNCDYDSERAFRKAGADVELLLIRNLNPHLLRDSLRELEAAVRRSRIVMLPGGFSAGDEPEGSAKFIATVFRNPAVRDAVRDLLQQRDGLMLGICNGFQALIKLGLLPCGDITDLSADSPTLTYNNIGRHVSHYTETRVSSDLSPWLMFNRPGDLHRIPVSHGEGRLAGPEEVLKELASAGQIVTQYVDPNGLATMQEPWNPNGSSLAIEGLCSPDGRILGKMAHSERRGENVAVNIPGAKDQRIFEAGVAYFR